MTPPDPSLRIIGPADSEFLAKLCTTAFHDAYANVHSKANRDAYCTKHYDPAKLARLLADTGTTCTVASNGKTPTGYLILKCNPCPYAATERAAELKQIYLLATAYGTGLGSRLLHTACSTARQQGADLIWLSVSDKNTRAQHFYQNNGFSGFGQGPDFWVGDDHLTSTILGRKP